MVQHAADGRGCAPAAPHQGSERPPMDTCKNWGNVKSKRGALILGIDFFLNLQSVSLINVADLFYLLTQDVIFQQEIHYIYYYPHKTKGGVHQSLLCQPSS